MSERELPIEPARLCLVSFSENSDHQNTLYGMFNALHDRYSVATVGARNPKSANAPRTPDNHYVECPARPGVTKGTFDLRMLSDTLQAIRETGSTTIYFESVHLWNCVIMALLGRGYTFVSTLHDVVPHDGSKSVLLCQKLQCRLSDYVVIKSERFLDDARRLYGLSGDKIRVFGVWRDYPDYRFTPGDGSFLFFGRLKRYKGLANMLRIARACPNQRFKVVGQPDEECGPVLEEMSTLPNVQVDARCVSDEQMEDYFRSSSWVLLPYESASQSGVVIDAYKYGKPVIGYDVGALPDQIKEGVTGYLVPADCLSECVACIEYVSRLSRRQYYTLSVGAYSFGADNYATASLSIRFANLMRILERGE